MKAAAGYTLQTDPVSAAGELQTKFQGFDVKAIIYFASSIYDPYLLSRAMFEKFPEAPTFGCTTAGEIVSGRILKHSISAMALSADIVEDMKIGVLKGIKGGADLESVFSSFENYFGLSMEEMDHTQYLGLILIDGLQGVEETVMEKIGDLTNVFFIGGSAGDDLKFDRTFVFADGEAYSDAAVLALMKLKCGYEIVKTQSFAILDKQLTVTKADTRNRKVIEFNHKPAAAAYAEALGEPVENIEQRFARNPVGLIIDGDPFVRSPRVVYEDGSIGFYCNILEGMELKILESTDIVRDMGNILSTKKGTGEISGVINFHCILRTLELQQKHQTEEYGLLFSDIPTAGFSTYGEQYIGHVNQTSTMLLFK